MRLRYYQQNALTAVYNYFLENTGNPIVAMPTGTGKSVVIGEFVRQVLEWYPGQRVMMLTHVKELIEQNFDKLLRLWPTAPAGIYSAGLGRKDAGCAVTYAGIATAVKRPDLFGKQDLLLIDECHLVSPDDETMYRSFIDALTDVNPGLKVIGFTATPYRLGLGMLTEGKLFTDVCYDITSMEAFTQLIDEGFLCRLVPRHTRQQLDVSGVGTRGGEFIPKALQAAVDKKEVTYAALQEVLELAGDRQHWLIFASGVDHAKHVAELLNEMGVPTTCVHSKMGAAERDEAIAGFIAGRYRAMVNNNVLTTGFDFPGIDLEVILRPTSSPGLWVQMLGRGTRPVYAPGFDLESREGRLAAIAASPKQNCLVLDFAGNTRRLGPINDPVLPRKKGEGTGEAPVRLCEHCLTYNHASARMCVHCGAEFPRGTKLQAQAGHEELVAQVAPIIELFAVDRITYSVHEKADKPASLKVSYYCGMRVFNEWVCLEHEGYAGRKATQWWIERACNMERPATVRAAMEFVGKLRSPSDIRVWVNKKYPEILTYVYGDNDAKVEEDFMDIPF